jgi:hypothetical protein
MANINAREDKLVIPFIMPPNIITDIDEITTSLLLSEIHKLSPIFHVQRHRSELGYFYEKYKEGIDILRPAYPELSRLSDANLRFGEAAFSIVNATVSSEAIAKQTPQAIIKPRSALAGARETFLSKDLLDLTTIVSDNPWNSSTAMEVDRFIQGQLRGGVVEYENQSAEIWHKMFGDLYVHAAEAAKNALFGGGVATGASGIIGLIAPGTSMWGMIALAAAAGIAKEGSGAIKSIVEATRELRKRSTSSISYVSKISRL